MEDQKPVFNAAIFRKKFITSFVLFFVFAVTYFGAAMINTAELKEIAAIMVFGLPVAFYLGVLVFVMGLVVTHLHLAKNTKDD